MPTITEITPLLKAMGYLLEDGKAATWVKSYGNHSNYKIRVDGESESIDYGSKITLGDKTTCNFKSSENFVVLECVNRLLEKGYKPESITLEQKWATGHGTSGKLDVLVTRDDGSAYLMIECKTDGIEFDKELKRIHANGGQLFTYFQQDKNAEVLMLYASKIDKNGEISYCCEIVKIEGDYRETGNVKDFYDRWNKLTKNNGVFEEWVSNYDFQSKALTPNSLKEITQEDSSFIFNQFLEILRHNVVSDKPNAFNKIFTLFLCKIYDERSTNDDDELAFQWFYAPYQYAGIKYPKDDHISFQKRLTDLYKKGMKEFLSKEVTDISDADFEKKYGSIDKEIKNKILKDIIEIRLKKNNEFAIKEVFDDESFEENAKVVKEVVELLQGYRIRYAKKQQYLSDFFELLLTTGLKQEAGQFFTPVPIAQFIIKSMPLETIIKEKLNKGENGNYLPSIIDYAAGSGHFLTESMHEIQSILNTLNPDDYIAETAKQIHKWKAAHFDWAYEYVYGIEKDYRLVKVGKVGCYLHGDGLAQIAHSDGLANFKKNAEYTGLLTKSDRDEHKDNKQFDIVVSNPPYSVSAFKNNARKYYTEDDFELYQYLTDQSSEIECLFVERTKQLLKDGGLAGIILPSSILSNTGIYTKTREMILKYFEIVGIAELGGNTFMATNTNTVTLFLRRRNNYDHINISNHIEKSFLNRADTSIHGIEKPISKYVSYVWDGLSYQDYLTFLEKKPNKNVLDHEIYKEYRNKITAKDEEAFWQNALSLEKEKAFYFVMTYEQKVVVVRSGEKKEEKEFLGYEFSNRRGNEGIHPIQGGKSIEECTKLFDPHRFDNLKKASTYLYKAFTDDFKTKIDESLKGNVLRHDLIDMMTFDRGVFDKTTIRSHKAKVKIESQWPLFKLGKIANINRGASPRPIRQYLTDDIDGVNWIKIGDVKSGSKYIEATKDRITKEGALKSYYVYPGDFIVSNSMSYGRPYILNIEGCIHDGWLVFSNFSDNIEKDFLFYVLSSNLAQDQFKSFASGGTSVDNLNIDKASNVQIPLPPVEVQVKIVEEIETIEKEEREAKNQIESLKTSIEDKLNTLHNKADQSVRLSDDDLFHVSIGQRVLKSQIIPDGKYPVYSANVFEPFGRINDLLITDFDTMSVVWGIDGDWMVNTIPKNTPFYPTDHCGVLRVKKPDIVHEKYLAYALLKEGERIGFSRSKRASSDRIKGVKIPMTPYKEQKQIAVDIEKAEMQIKGLQEKLEHISAAKDAILKKYL